MTSDRDLLKQALEALEVLAKYENPLTKIQVRKPRDGGPIVTMYPHKVASDAAAPLRERLAQPEQYQRPQMRRATREEKIDRPGVYWVPVNTIANSEAIPEQISEPVAMRYDFDGYGYRYIDSGSGSNWQTRIKDAEPLYTSSPRREWVGLTDEEIGNLWDGHTVPVFGKTGINPIVFARAIEAKLREKNGSLHTKKYVNQIECQRCGRIIQ